MLYSFKIEIIKQSATCRMKTKLFYCNIYYRNIVFLSASVLGVLVVLSVYDEDVLTVEHVLSIITILGCVLAAARYVYIIRFNSNSTDVSFRILTNTLI